MQATAPAARFPTLYRAIDWFLPRDAADRMPASLRRLRLAVGASLFLLANIILVIPLHIAAGGDPLILRGMLLAGPLLAFNLLLPRWSSSDTLPGTLFSLEILSMLLFIPWQPGANTFATCTWLVAIPLLASFLAGTRLAAVCAALAIGDMLLLLFQGWRHPGPLSTPFHRWILFDTAVLTLFVAILAWLYESFRQRAEQEETRRHLAERERLEKEVEIAARIQSSILPETMQVRGLEIATRMMPAHEVGGDYYDILPTEDGCWLAIGDVSGHGLNAGLIMLMLQSMVSVLSQQSPKAAPRDLLTMLNRALFDSIRNRLKKDDYVTLSLLRYHHDGLLVFAGAHEDILIYRASERRCERLETRGTWVGAMRNIDRFSVDTSCQLREGDTLLLYTDGITEAMNAAGEQFGIERLVAEFQRLCDQSVSQIRDRLVEQVQGWMSQQQDDLTLVVLRHHETAAKNAAA